MDCITIGYSAQGAKTILHFNILRFLSRSFHQGNYLCFIHRAAAFCTIWKGYPSILYAIYMKFYMKKAKNRKKSSYVWMIIQYELDCAPSGRNAWSPGKGSGNSRLLQLFGEEGKRLPYPQYPLTPPPPESFSWLLEPSILKPYLSRYSARGQHCHLSDRHNFHKSIALKISIE